MSTLKKVAIRAFTITIALLILSTANVVLAEEFRIGLGALATLLLAGGVFIIWRNIDCKIFDKPAPTMRESFLSLLPFAAIALLIAIT